jgi:hypothetical protein
VRFIISIAVITNRFREKVSASIVIIALFLTVSFVFGQRASLKRSNGGLTHFSIEARALVDEHLRNSLSERIRRLPLIFEMNKGQSPASGTFLARTDKFALSLAPNEVIFSTAPNRQDSAGEVRSADHIRAKQVPDLVKMTLGGHHRRNPIVEGLEGLQGVTNYLIGKDSKDWYANVSTFNKVRYKDVYPGIDQVFYGSRENLEYDFVVSPGADPKTIRLSFGRKQKLAIDDQGNLVVQTKRGNIFFHQPVVYQDKNHSRDFISGRYVLNGRNEVTFDVGAYDSTKQLVIDPTVSISTYVGASGFDEINSIAIDANRNIYVAGSTTSPEYSSTNGLNAFVMKLTPNGNQRIYFTVIGGSGDDRALGLAVDSSNDAYITGTTESADFATTNALQANFGGGNEDAFITKIDSTGSSLLFSSYIGGSGDDIANGIALDGTGGAYVTGSTDSPEFSPVGATDAFVTKFSPTGNQRVYFKTIGGSGDDVGSAIAVDNQGDAYITGITNSTDFPTMNASQSQATALNDAFVAKLNPTGSTLVYSTYVGGSGDDKGFGIAVDGLGSAYVVGSTTSPEFSPVGESDIFVTKLNPTGDQRVYFATIGGSGNDVGHSIAVDQNGNAYLTGSTESNNFTTANPSQGNMGGGNQDAFVTKLNGTGSTLLFSTFLGGTGNEVGLGLVIDSDKNIYVGGCTTSLDFPIVNPSLQSANASNGDGFIAKIIGVDSPNPTPTPTTSPSPTPTPLSSPTSLQLLLDQSGPGVNQVVAFDSVLLLRDQFSVLNGNAFFNSAADKNTRVTVFLMNLQLAQGETSSNVVVNLVDSNNESYDVLAEDVRQVPNFQFTQVTFRLPNSLASGTCTIKVEAHGQASNSGTIRIK